MKSLLSSANFPSCAESEPFWKKVKQVKLLSGGPGEGCLETISENNSTQIVPSNGPSLSSTQ